MILGVRASPCKLQPTHEQMWAERLFRSTIRESAVRSFIRSKGDHEIAPAWTYRVNRVRLIYFSCAAGARNKRLEDSRMAARKNGSKTTPGFASGITGGLLFITLFVVWAILELSNVEAPATTKMAAPIAKALRRASRKLELCMISQSIDRSVTK